VIPGHGRLSDEADVLEYRDMLTIIRDRIQDLVKKGSTLEQVKAARPTLDYDGRYGATAGSWTTATFIEAVYRTLAARGETPAAFGRRCIPADCVAPPSHIPDTAPHRAQNARWGPRSAVVALLRRGPHGADCAPWGGTSGRLAALGATLDFHHGLLARTGVVAHADRLDYNLATFDVRLHRLTLATSTARETPFLTADDVHAALGWRILLGRLDVTLLEIVHPRLALLP
jgi:hypothetical protein